MFKLGMVLLLLMGSIKGNSMEVSDRLKLLMQREGYAGTLKNTTSFTGLKGERNKRVKGSSKYGLYYDSLGKLTAGVGDLITDNQEAHDKLKLSKEKALEQLKKNVNIHDEEATKILKENNIDTSKWTTSQKDAFNDMVFQLGGIKTRKFKDTLKALAKSNFSKAAEQVSKSKWAGQTPIRVEDFKKRIVIKKLKEEVSDKSVKKKRLEELRKQALPYAEFERKLKEENLYE